MCEGKAGSPAPDHEEKHMDRIRHNLFGLAAAIGVSSLMFAVTLV